VVHDVFVTAREALTDCSDRLHKFAFQLCPIVLQDLGLTPALRSLSRKVSETGALNAEVTVFGEERRVRDDVELAAFRIVQEALTNALKHAQATLVSSRVTFLADSIEILISDNGYLLKQCHPAELQSGVLQVFAGERVLHDSVIRTLIARTVNRSATPPRETLSEREREVLQLLADGATSKEIAVVLGLKPKTVENHRARILDKLGVANAAAAVRVAVAQGLVSQMSESTPNWRFRVA
jgi:DNA-binding NarL/FixJ family response regulator